MVSSASSDLVVLSSSGSVSSVLRPNVPILIAAAGERAAESYIEFFAARIRNRNTRAAYLRATSSFLHWCNEVGLHDLARLTPTHVGTYIESLLPIKETATVKLHLAALKMLFDHLAAKGVIAGNPAAYVKSPKLSVNRGKTPVLTGEQAQTLLRSIPTDTIAGLRDRALIAVMIFSFARVSAVLGMARKDYYSEGKRSFFRFLEKGGKRHTLPAHLVAEDCVDAYLAVANFDDDEHSPLFRALDRRGHLTTRPLTRTKAWAMVQRRVNAAGLDTHACCHTFRATGITRYLECGGTIENAKEIAAHASIKTTQLYDRRRDSITLEEINRITLA